jgi:TonB family protein
MESTALLLLPITLMLSQADTPAQAMNDPVPLHFVLQTSALKKHAVVENNELTVTGGAGQPYLSSVNLGDFEASGEMAIRDPSDVSVLVGTIVDPDGRVHRRERVVLPPSIGSHWLPVVVSCVARHLSVAVDGHVVAEQQIERDPYGRFGFEVERGTLSLRGWRVVRRDAYLDPQPLTARSPDVIEIGKLPDGVAMPRLKHEVRPAYPEGAAQRGAEGTVEVEAIVEGDGSVSAVRLVKSVDDDVDRAVVQAVRQWRFEPLTIAGRAVRWHLVVTIPFQIHPR